VSSLGFQGVVERYRDTLDAFVRGDPAPTKELWSRRDDVTLANPLGAPARGWADVEAVLDRSAAQVRDGAPLGFELVSSFASADLGYVLWIERTKLKIAEDGFDAIRPIALRVTTIIRREEDGWRITHRHADPITTPRPVESIVADG
jgi:ketosteroid isomerase-like protein